jgi:Ca2+-binding EF-hand superfamily protein
MVAFPTCLLLVLLVLRLKMDSIEEQLTPPLKRILEEDGIKARTFKCGLHSSSYPKSKQQKKQEQEQLFWFGRHGPLFLERSVQMVLLLVVCFAAAYIGSLSGMGVTWSSVMSFLVNSLVVGVLLWILPSTLHVLTLITSIEEMKKRKHINGTMELVHQELHVQILQMLLLLKGHNVVKWAKKVQPGDAAAERQRLYRQVADQEILKTLADDAFRAGCIGRCVRHFGFFLTDVEIQNIINSMQDCGICTKGVSTSNEDFYVILAALEEQKGKVMDLESLRALFDEIDLTHSGTISAHELHQALTRYSEGADTLGVGKEDCRAFIREARHFAGEMEGEEAEEVTLEALIKWIKSLENRLCTHILAD